MKCVVGRDFVENYLNEVTAMSVKQVDDASNTAAINGLSVNFVKCVCFNNNFSIPVR